MNDLRNCEQLAQDLARENNNESSSGEEEEAEQHTGGDDDYSDEDDDKVDQAAKKIGCAILQVPFSYLGSKVGCLMSRIQSWSEIVNNILTRLSKWKLKTLSIGGRLTLLKSVLDVISLMVSSITERSQYGLNGIKFWLLKKREVLEFRVLSFYALNRALLFKWVWRFCTQQSALWTKIIKGIHGEDEKIGKHVRSHHQSLWLDIFKEVHHIQRQGTDLIGFINKKMGNGTQKNISVALKLSHDDLLCLFRKAPRAGAEELQYIQLVKIMEGITLFDSKDRWR
ncbi:hypothetical protein Tco_1194759, partial [Tanacetum coccineum]